MAYTDMSAGFEYKEVVKSRSLRALAENDAALKISGWQDGTKAVFYQASAPTGWTKDTTYNDRILRVVSETGGGGDAGTQGISSAITLAHTHDLSSQANHLHDYTHSHTLTTATASNAAASGSTSGAFSDQGALVQYHAGGSEVTTGAITKDTDDSSPGQAAAGTHDHGVTTGSQLSNTTLAYVDIIICSKDSGGGTYTDKTASFPYGADIGDIELWDDLDDLTNNDAYLNTRLTPAGSVSLFFNASAPVGWTKAVSQNDKAVRVVSGSGGGSGGTTSLSSGVTLAHSGHTITSDGSHLHTVGAHTHTPDTVTTPAVNTSAASANTGVVVSGGTLKRAIAGGSTLNLWDGGLDTKAVFTTSTDSDHTHTLQSSLSDLSLAYIDMIQCSKDATGSEPFVYQDLTSFFGTEENLLAYQDLNDLGKNDSHIKYRTIPGGSFCLFYQAAAPLGWTKSTTHNDKSVRIVSGSGGGSGGSDGIAGGITLAHTHTIDAYDHTHTLPHTHSITTASTGSYQATNGALVDLGLGYLKLWGSGASTVSSFSGTYASFSGNSANDSHAHGDDTSSELSDVTLAYIDVVNCEKNTF